MFCLDLGCLDWIFFYSKYSGCRNSGGIGVKHMNDDIYFSLVLSTRETVVEMTTFAMYVFL